MRDLERPARGGMGATYGRQLEQDVGRRRSQLGDARRLLSQAEQRETRIAQRLEVVRSGGGGSRSSSRGAPSRPRQLPSVEEELQRMKQGQQLSGRRPEWVCAETWACRATVEVAEGGDVLTISHSASLRTGRGGLKREAEGLRPPTCATRAMAAAARRESPPT
eukprot:1820903-Prymnesium_polylepis.1